MDLLLTENIEDPAGNHVGHDQNGNPLTAGQLLGQSLLLNAAKSEDDIMKYYDWGFALSKGKAIQIDNADREKLKKFVIDLDRVSNIVKGYFLMKLNDLKK